MVETEFEPVIGLEVHVQLQTRSKMFCGCDSDYQNASPNEHVCPVCLGLPGALPVINKAAVEMVIKAGLALHSDIAEYTKFDRKNYPYPDLMKGYQISQFDLPICVGGYLDIQTDGEPRRIHMTRVHLEEDAAKLLHRPNDASGGHTLVDVNRAGSALMEMVGEPDIRTPDEARAFLVQLRAILRYIGVSAANMEEGNLRCDANVSVRPKGSDQMNSKVEVKNMNSFRAVQRALVYEIDRQTRLMKEGQPIAQETRGWVEDRGVTVSQRSKEQAHDYRYFPEPDLPPLIIGRDWVEQLRSQLPELPEAKQQRFAQQYGLSPYDSDLLTTSKEIADWFEAVVATKAADGEALGQRAKAASNWILGELTRLLNATGKELSDIPMQPQHLSELLDLLDDRTLSTSMAKDVFEDVFNTGRTPSEVVKEKGFTQVADADSLSPMAAEAIASNPKAVEDYMAGRDTAVKFLVGQVMKLSRGQANPSLAEELLRARLEERKGGA
ncbi:MAG: aspartyl-tRNA(Asn)/glutamyl-tRNA(Gln) amidotransferase subunit B [Chloroflexi bacterium]|nr:MAG: aspartyl-tRNA(Asn)/glutamyl-tRNA(Gln) amidotransferase subunit B [Chloroflexota bacterium]